MSKATPSDVIALGFTHEMFGPVVDAPADFPAYVQAILDENVDEVKDLVGAALYDDSTKAADIKRIEKYLAAAELWRRRANIVQAVATPDGPTGESERKRADEYTEDALRIVDRLRGRTDVAMSVESSSHFPQDSSGS